MGSEYTKKEVEAMCKYDIGDKVWLICEGVAATITSVNIPLDGFGKSNGYRSYALRQSRKQKKKWGKLNWHAWPCESDLLPYKDRPRGDDHG